MDPSSVSPKLDPWMPFAGQSDALIDMRLLLAKFIQVDAKLLGRLEEHIPDLILTPQQEDRNVRKAILVFDYGVE